MILTSVWIAIAIAADPRGDFSLNDDWAFGLPDKAFVESGSIRFTFWRSMTLIAQVFWGALFCLPTGFSFDSLRFSSLVAGLVGVLGLYALLRQYRTGPITGMIGAIALAVNPLYFGLSCTFMTDVAFMALMILSVA
jgi:Dolichyl-phosphate-mannose-protein mannosyltransferase